VLFHQEGLAKDVLGAWIEVVEPELGSVTAEKLRAFVHSYLMLSSVNLSYEQAYEFVMVDLETKNLPHLLPPAEFHTILGQLGHALDTSNVADPFETLGALEARLYGKMATLFKVPGGRIGIGMSEKSHLFLFFFLPVKHGTTCFVDDEVIPMHTRSNLAEKTNPRKTRGRGCEVHAVGTADFFFRIGASTYQPGRGSDPIQHFVGLLRKSSPLLLRFLLVFPKAIFSHTLSDSQTLGHFRSIVGCAAKNKFAPGS
jgi:hypothetical protein